MIRAIIFDMGGVLIMNKIGQVYITLADSLAIDKQLFLQLINQNKLKLMNGEYSANDFALLMKQKFKLHDDIADIVGKWRQAFVSQLAINQELFDIIQKLKTKYKICLITNAPDLHAKINKENGLYKPFKPLIISCEVGLVKPQRQIFDLAIKELKLKPEDCIFVDDEEKNIEIPKCLGFKVMHFTDNKQFCLELKQLNVEF
jgi:epoxide hydrolase-like predicted phosphatase